MGREPLPDHRVVSVPVGPAVTYLSCLAERRWIRTEYNIICEPAKVLILFMVHFFNVSILYVVLDVQCFFERI